MNFRYAGGFVVGQNAYFVSDVQTACFQPPLVAAEIVAAAAVLTGDALHGKVGGQGGCIGAGSGQAF